jgi:hypothetical protein
MNGARPRWYLWIGSSISNRREPKMFFTLSTALLVDSNTSAWKMVLCWKLGPSFIPICRSLSKLRDNFQDGFNIKHRQTLGAKCGGTMGITSNLYLPWLIPHSCILLRLNLPGLNCSPPLLRLKTAMCLCITLAYNQYYNITLRPNNIYAHVTLHSIIKT